MHAHPVPPVLLPLPMLTVLSVCLLPSAAVPESTVGLSFNGSNTPSAASTTAINASPNTPIVGQEVYTTTSPGTTVRIIGTSPTSGTLTYSNANLSIIKVSN